MIRDLAAYNAWKRSTLDRLTSKYAKELATLWQKRFEKIEGKLIEAVESGADTFAPDTRGLEQQIMAILKKHRYQTIYVSVSDGIREVTPDKKLSTWENWPYWHPVEDTFITLNDKRQRKKIFDFIIDKIGDARIDQERIMRFQKKMYLDLVSRIFKRVSKSYFHDEKVKESRENVIERLQESVQRESHYFENVTRNHAEMVFRTETTRYFNEARVAYFEHSTEVDFIQLVAITDGRVSDICESRDGYVVPLKKAGDKKYKPPFHPNCRTVQSPLTTDVKADAEEVRRNLGSEFGKVHSDTSDADFIGKRTPPKVPLPRGWV